MKRSRVEAGLLFALAAGLVVFGGEMTPYNLWVAGVACVTGVFAAITS